MAKNEQGEEDLKALLRYHGDKKTKGHSRATDSHIDLQPAPPLGNPGHANWKANTRPKGPIGLLLDSLHHIGAVMDDRFRISTPYEPDVDINALPYNQVRPTMLEMAARARTASATNTRKETQGLLEIDRVATNVSLPGVEVHKVEQCKRVQAANL